MASPRMNLGIAASLVTICLACNGSKMTGPGDSSGSSSPASSASALLSVAPASASTNVPRTGPIVMQFNGAMMVGMEQFIDLHKGDVAGPVIPMSCTWSTDRKTLTCVPGTLLDAQTTYALHMGMGMTGTSGAVIDMSAGRQMGGQEVTSGMMNGSHAGQSMSMMGAGWKGADGSFGMTFTFTTL